MSNFNPLSIDMLLHSLGAKKDALDVESPIEPVRRIPFQGLTLTGVYFGESY